MNCTNRVFFSLSLSIWMLSSFSSSSSYYYYYSCDQCCHFTYNNNNNYNIISSPTSTRTSAVPPRQSFYIWLFLLRLHRGDHVSPSFYTTFNRRKYFPPKNKKTRTKTFGKHLFDRSTKKHWISIHLTNLKIIFSTEKLALLKHSKNINAHLT